MAEFNAPYKNNTIRGMIKNADAYADYITDEAGKAWVIALENLANTTYDVSEALYNMWKDTVDSVWNFFTWEAESNVKDATAPINAAPTVQVNWWQAPVWPVAFDKQWALDYANSIRQKQQQTEQTAQWWQPTAQWTQPTTTTWWTGNWWTQTNQGTNQTSINTPTFSSVEDVVYYLAQQPWWNSLTEEQRVAMVDDLWSKQSAAAWQTTQDTTSEQWNTKGSFWNWYAEDVTQRMQSDLQVDTTGDIYWKTTWSSSAGISTNADVNSAFVTDVQWRIARVQEILLENPYALATAILWWTNPYSEQVMRDVKTYAPEYWSQVQDYMKQIQVGNNVNAIASWESIKTVADTTDVKNDTVTYAVNNSTQSVSATNLLNSIDQKLAMNNDASTAESTMDSIAEEMERQKKRLNNLRKEANEVFKWDASQQIVNAYISNKSQEIQNELSILEWRYNAALDRYKLAVSHAERAADYELKKNSLQLDWYKELNKTSTTTTSSGVWSMRTERHNNPTAMTVWWMQWAWIEPDWLYEIWDPFTSTDANWVTHTYYTAKLLWDPLDTTIKILNQAIANWHNPFNTGSWSYMNQLWMNIEKWNSMTDDQRKSFIVNDWLPHEWWDITKMAYYAWNNSSKSTNSYDLANSKLYDMYLDPAKRPNEKFVENAAKVAWQSVEDFANSARAYQADLEAWLIQNTTPWEIKSSYAYEMLEMFANLYNHVDDNWNNKVDFSRRNPFLYEFDLWNQIRENMTLESMVSAKERDVNFWSVTEAEWTMLRNAASAIWSAYWGFDTTMDDEFQRMIRVLWKKAYWDENFNLDKWTDFRKEYEKKAAWANPDKLIKSTASEWLSSWQNDSWVYTEPTDWNYVNAYWIIW